MSKALYRGLSTPERNLRLQEQQGSPREAEGGERARSRSAGDHLTACFPHSVRLWIKQVCQDHPFSASHRHGLKSSDSNSRSGKALDGGSTGSLVGVSSGSPRHQSLGSRFFPTFSCDQNIFLPFVLLCFVGACVLLAITGTAGPYPRVVFPAHNYRRAELLVQRDLYHGGILGLGSLKPKEVEPCRSGTEDYVPCHNLTANVEAGHGDGLELERHCGVGEKKQCLIPPPKEYRIQLKWPDCRDGIWRWNLQIDTEKDRFIVEENRLKFPAKDPQLMDTAGSYADRVASLLNLESSAEFQKENIRNVLDIGCGSSSLGDFLWSQSLIPLCVAPYEEHGGQVQLSLERGLPGMIGSFRVTQLPYPSSSFDLIHCANCGVDFNQGGGKPIVEIDRLLRPGGYFVWVKPRSGDEDEWEKIQNATATLCWGFVSKTAIVIWQKKPSCFGPNVCEQGRYEADWSWHQPLRPCITLSPPVRRLSVQNQAGWPSRLHIAPTDGREEVSATVAEYWSLLTPMIFSDHPKRLGDDDVQPASSVVRNIMDLNAGNGGLNAALLDTGKPVWVMNVVPTSAPSNTLPFIFDRGLIGTNHDWCEAFPTYPRTYDLLHAAELLTQELKRPIPCGLSNLFSEMDRILRPEGWVILRDHFELIEDARAVATQMRWDSRMIEIPGLSEERLLVCQKSFWKP